MSTSTLRWLRGVSRTPRYIGLGDRPGRLYPLLSYMTGLRDLTERLVLKLPEPWVAAKRPLPEPARYAVNEVLRDRERPAAALFLYTGYYKETVFVGPVLNRGSDAVFWKAFKGEDEVQRELGRVGAIRRVLPPSGRLAACSPIGAGVVEYEWVERSRRSATRSELVKFALELGQLAVRAEGGGSVPIAEPSPLPKEEVVKGFADLEGVHIHSIVPAMIDQMSALRHEALFWSHGDLTRWNVFPTVGKRLGVVDYDAVGLRPPMYDVVHLLTQEAVERRISPPVRLLGEVLRDYGGQANLAACLFWDAYETMHQYLANPKNRVRTGPAAHLKLEAWSGVAANLGQ